jgi:hypothetical protein
MVSLASSPPHFLRKRSEDFTNEKKEYNRRVNIKFPKNAWCDESEMSYWVFDMWRRPLAPEAQKSKLLIADVHKAQKTPEI